MNYNNKLFKEAKRYISGGVNSPVRSFKAVGGEPIFIKKAKGAKIYAENGRGYIDYCQGYGALILGHAHPEVCAKLRQVITGGTIFATPTKSETGLAKVINKAIPSIEKVRFVNSGTEAVMGAIRLARAYTKKDKIIKFKGSYHGHADYLLNCPGIPKDFTRHTITAPYNDIVNVKEIIHGHRQDIAGIIIEPVAGNSGVVLPKEGFLKELRQVASKYNIVLIFDEVITGFRFLYGGAQDLFKAKPDLTCLGKIIGGGLPIGAFGGRKEIMRLLSPEGSVYQAGTFSGNPVSINAGLATLKILARDNPYKKLTRLTCYLCEQIKERAKIYGINLKLDYIGPMFGFSAEEKLFKKIYHGLLKEGIYFAPSAKEANFLSAAHTETDIRKTINAIDRVFKAIGRN